MSENNNCDGSGPHDQGRVKVLPTGGDGNAILCRCCFEREISYRIDRNKDLGADAQFLLPSWGSLRAYHEDNETTIETRCWVLADLITEQTKAEYLAKGYTLDHHANNWVARVKVGAKYTKVDIGSSGRYMVDNATGEIFGIKGYGVIHRGHRFGTLETIADWQWGGYRAFKREEVAA